MNIWKRLWLALTADQDFDTIYQQTQQDRFEKERISRMHNLNLCFKHRQEEHYSHYSEHNCDYCKLLEQRDELRNILANQKERV